MFENTCKDIERASKDVARLRGRLSCYTIENAMSASHFLKEAEYNLMMAHGELQAIKKEEDVFYT